jgi:hypothetical protein
MTDRDRRYRISVKGRATEARRAQTEGRKAYRRKWARDKYEAVRIDKAINAFEVAKAAQPAQVTVGENPGVVEVKASEDRST